MQFESMELDNVGGGGYIKDFFVLHQRGMEQANYD